MKHSPRMNTKVPRMVHRSVKQHPMLVRDSNGTLRDLRPEDTLWYLLYVANPPVTLRMLKLFRLRFRVPYDTFLILVEDIKEDDRFSQWNSSDATGVKASDIHLLLLGVLRYIGRGWTLDDVSEANGISRTVNRLFLTKFIEYGSTVLYKRWVLEPSRETNVGEYEALFKASGFDGCIGSVDATHVPIVTCPHWARNIHKGFKLSMPARSYNVTVDHSRRVLGSTCGHPSTWNDKTLILFDEFISNVHNGKVPDQFQFKLFEKDKNGNVIQVLYKGVWFICDNGYLSWSCTVPPDSNAKTYDEIRFSEWLESMRKDVECFFGIMKGRFLIFRYGFRLHKIYQCDQMWLTCCALHNMLLEIDGLHENWELGAKSDWEKCSSDLEIYDRDIPFAIERLNRHNAEENLNQNQESNQNIDHDDIFKQYTVDGKRIVAKMPFMFG